MPDLFNDALKGYLGVLLGEDGLDVVEDVFAGQGGDFARTAEDFDTLANEEDFACCFMVDEGEGDEGFIEGVDVPTCEFDILGRFGEFKLLLGLLDGPMDEELVLGIDDLPVGNPRNYLIDKDSFTLPQDHHDPLLEPLVALLQNFPQDVDDDPSSVLFGRNTQHDLPNLLHY
jgi:hypothetical protein